MFSFFYSIQGNLTDVEDKIYFHFYGRIVVLKLPSQQYRIMFC